MLGLLVLSYVQIFCKELAAEKRLHGVLILKTLLWFPIYLLVATRKKKRA